MGSKPRARNITPCLSAASFEPHSPSGCESLWPADSTCGLPGVNYLGHHHNYFWYQVASQCVVNKISFHNASGATDTPPSHRSHYDCGGFAHTFSGAPWTAPVFVKRLTWRLRNVLAAKAMAVSAMRLQAATRLQATFRGARLRVVLAARAMAASAVAAGLWLADAQGTARAVPRELECGTRTGRSARPPRTPSCAPCPTRHCIAAIGGTPRTSVRR